MVSWQQLHAPVWNEELFIPPDHHHTYPVGKVKVPHGVTLGEVFFSYDMVPEDSHFIREFQAEGFHFRILVIAQFQQPGDEGQGGSLYDQRQEGDAEYDVEDVGSSLQSGDDGAEGEEDGTSTFESYP